MTLTPTISATKKPAAVALFAGAIAGGIEALTVWPTENIKTQLQLQGKVAEPKFTTFSGGVRFVVRTQGVGALYTGLVPILIGSLPKVREKPQTPLSPPA